MIGTVLESDMQRIPPSLKSGQIFFLSKKMHNVLKCMQKQFSHFLLIFLVNKIFI